MKQVSWIWGEEKMKQKKPQWEGILAGNAMSLFFMLLFYFLGIELKAVPLEIETNFYFFNSVIVWTVLAVIIANFLGGFTTAIINDCFFKLSAGLQGVLAWASSAVLLSIIFQFFQFLFAEAIPLNTDLFLMLLLFAGIFGSFLGGVLAAASLYKTYKQDLQIREALKK